MPAASADKPATVKLYFETGKADAPADASKQLETIVAFLKANGGAKVAISGFHDSTGAVAANEEIAKNRAKAVRDILKGAGIDEARAELKKPEVVQGGPDNNEARRVEVSIQ